ncbi:Outer dense fiber protein 3, partial [Apaloderma vittatum]
RPHHPRGLILAQFASPGPKYAVPGTIGYLAHNPTKTKASVYTFQGAKPPTTDCSPGPRYFSLSSVTRSSKYMAPAQPIWGWHPDKIEVTPRPSDSCTKTANKHIYKRVPEQPMAFRHKAGRASQTPGLNTYTLPRLMGPNTTYTHTSPCFSMAGRSKHSGFAREHCKTPGPAAFPKVEAD